MARGGLQDGDAVSGVGVLVGGALGRRDGRQGPQVREQAVGWVILMGLPQIWDRPSGAPEHPVGGKGRPAGMLPQAPTAGHGGRVS